MGVVRPWIPPGKRQKSKGLGVQVELDPSACGV